MSQSGAPAECEYCDSPKTQRKPTNFSLPKRIGAQPEVEAAEHSVPGLHAAGPNANLTVVDGVFKGGGRAVQIDGGKGAFLRSKFEGHREDVVLKGEARGYTEDCEFR